MSLLAADALNKPKDHYCLRCTFRNFHAKNVKLELVYSIEKLVWCSSKLNAHLFWRINVGHFVKGCLIEFCPYSRSVLFHQMPLDNPVHTHTQSIFVAFTNRTNILDT